MKKPTKEQIKRWSQMTDQNDHGEVRVEMAEWFQQTKEWNEKCRIRDYASAFRYINAIHEREQHLDMELCIIRNIITHCMTEEISRFSKAIGDMVNICL